jgi:hypothetical protein
MSLSPVPNRHAAILLLTVLTVLAAACGGDEDLAVVEGVIDRETFIQVYVDLRDAAVRSPDLVVSEASRDEVLARHGVDEESLMAFIDAYGADLDYMNELWAEVEQRVEALPPVPREESGSGA